MNRYLLIAATALVVSGCVSDSPVYVTGIYSLDPAGKGDCKLEGGGGIQQAAGSLDLTGGTGYRLVIKVTNDLDATLDTKADNSTLVTGKHRNTVIFDQISLTYTTVPSSVVLDPEILPITAISPPGGDTVIPIGLFGPKAYEKLALSAPNAGDRIDVRVKFEFRGSIISGGRLTSTPISFPVSIYRSGLTCPAGQTFGRTGACGQAGGQDNARLCCSGDMTCTVTK